MKKIKTGSKVTIISTGVTGTLGDYNRSKRKYEITDKGFKVIGMYSRSEFIEASEAIEPKTTRKAKSVIPTIEQLMTVGTVYHHASDRKEINYTVVSATKDSTDVTWENEGGGCRATLKRAELEGYLKAGVVTLVKAGGTKEATPKKVNGIVVGCFVSPTKDRPNASYFNKGEYARVEEVSEHSILVVALKDGLKWYIDPEHLTVVTPTSSEVLHSLKLNKGDMVKVVSKDGHDDRLAATWVSGMDKAIGHTFRVVDTTPNDVKLSLQPRNFWFPGQSLQVVSRAKEVKEVILPKFKVGDEMEITRDNPSAASLSKGDEVTIASVVNDSDGNFIYYSVRHSLTGLWSVKEEALTPKKPKPTAKKVNKTEFHSMILEELDLKVGDTIRIVRKVPDREFGWNNSWAPDMDSYIGKEYVVSGTPDNKGIPVTGPSMAYTFRFPAQGVELVKRKPSDIIVSIGAAKNREVTVSKGTIRSAGENITIKQIQDLYAHMKKDISSPLWSIKINSVDIGCCTGVTSTDLEDIMKAYETLNK